MKTKILARQAVVTAGMAYEDLKKVQEYAPEKMSLNDADGNETFRVALGQDCVSPIGITFTKEGEEAIARIQIPPDVEDKKAYIAENFGVAIAKAGKVIEDMTNALEDVNSVIKNVADSIESVD